LTKTIGGASLGAVSKEERLMGLIDEAIALEERAETNYRSAAEMTSDPSAAKILELLADQEAEHARALRVMNVGTVGSAESLVEAGMDWIGGVIEGAGGAISTDSKLRDVLQRAMEIERATERFYRERGASASDRSVAELFARLAAIEKLHFLFVSSLVEYFDRPAEWVESAEFGLRPPY
jgi:rubrerythrin